MIGRGLSSADAVLQATATTSTSSEIFAAIAIACNVTVNSAGWGHSLTQQLRILQNPCTRVQSDQVLRHVQVDSNLPRQPSRSLRPRT